MSRLRPLRKKTKEGVLYKRRVRTEELIYNCLELSFKEFSNRAKIIDSKLDGYISSEVLVYFLRETKVHDNDTQFGVIYQLLVKRIQKVCSRIEIRLGQKDGTIHLQDFQDFVLDDFTKRVVRDRQDYNEKLDGYEVAFDQMIARRKKDSRRKMRRRDKPKTQLEYNEDGEISNEVEESLARLNPNQRSIEDNVTYRFQLQRAIETLPEDEKRVINMIFAGIPSESTDPDIPTISKILECGPQTVRNRRNRAVMKLKEILGTEVNDVN